MYNILLSFFQVEVQERVFQLEEKVKVKPAQDGRIHAHH
jgi:hypothetical protein